MKRNIGRIIMVVLSLAVISGTVWYLDNLCRQMAQEETKRINIWAEATQRLIDAKEDEDIDFYTTIIEQNTSIPVYMISADGEILLTRNVDVPVADTSLLHGPIVLDVGDQVQYIYYDESRLIRSMRYFPYVMLLLILVFIIALVYVVRSELYAEQNRVWIGLTKETAHQLGTPISSLNGWQELLESTYPNDALIPEIRKDIARLGVIAERFGKVGSVPQLRQEDLGTVVDQTVDYMKLRLGGRVQMVWTQPADPCMIDLSSPLFSWVMENLIKNAVDAGATKIEVTLTEEGECYQVDVMDNGHGISGRPNRVFNPGFTTKRRGWGLGLSLARRIVEQYHHGILKIQKTEAGIGTTFRILLFKS